MTKWRTIENYSRYEVSDSGEVRNAISGKILKPCYSTGYVHVTLCDENGHYQTTVHRLVAEAFVANPNNDVEINHLDGDKHNNAADNLEWCDRSHNMRHAYATGLQHVMPEQLEYSLKKAQKAHERPVRNIETGVSYSSVKECAVVEGLSRPAISFHITGKAKKPRFEYID